MLSILESVKDPANATLLEKVDRFVINAVPDHIRKNFMDSDMYSILVESRGEGRWAVLHHSNAYDVNLQKAYESTPSNRTDDFIDQYRHDLPTAIGLAEQLAETIVVMRMDYRAFVEWAEAKEVELSSAGR